MADDGSRQALWLSAGATMSMSLMAAVSATIGGPDGVVAVLGSAVMAGGGILAFRAIDHDSATTAAYDLPDREAVYDTEIVAGLREVA